MGVVGPARTCTSLVMTGVIVQRERRYDDRHRVEFVMPMIQLTAGRAGLVALPKAQRSTGA